MNIPEGYAQVNHFFAGTAYPRGAQITYGIAVDATPNLPALLTELSAAFKTAWQPVMPISVQHTKVRIKVGPNDTGAFSEGGTTFDGSFNTAVDSPQVAVLIRKNTDTGGRTGSGRLFMPIVAEGSTTSGGSIAPADLAQFQAKADIWLAGIAAGAESGPMVLLHSDVEAIPSLVTSLTVQGLLATQRRRIRKVGGRRRVV